MPRRASAGFENGRRVDLQQTTSDQRKRRRRGSNLPPHLLLRSFTSFTRPKIASRFCVPVRILRILMPLAKCGSKATGRASLCRACVRFTHADRVTSFGGSLARSLAALVRGTITPFPATAQQPHRRSPRALHALALHPPGPHPRLHRGHGPHRRRAAIRPRPVSGRCFDAQLFKQGLGSRG